MHNSLLLVLAVILGMSGPAQAQTFQITATGTLSAGTGSFSSVTNGTTFQLSETFNVATATLTSSSTTTADYQDPTGHSSFSFGTFSFTGTAPLIEIDSNESGVYGFVIGQQLSGGASYGIQLLGSSSTIAPTTSLSNLRTLPLSDFSPGIGNAAIYHDTGNDSIQGVVTSFSVQAVPEPRAIAVATLAALSFIGLRVLRQRKLAASR